MHTAALENSGIQWIRVALDYHQEFYYCYQVFSSNPENPGFCPHTNPGLRVWKSAGLPGFSGARYPGCILYLEYHTKTITRGNKYKLRNQSFHYDVRKYSFTPIPRIANITWNSLPDYVVNVDFVEVFKNV